jgi:hypothetical protein
MSDSMKRDAGAKLTKDVQRSLGAALRETYGYMSRGIPAHFIELWCRLRDQDTQHEKTPSAFHRSALTNKGTPEEELLDYHDPQTISVLGAAFDEAWTTLSGIGNASRITREELARQILQLSEQGERHRGRLASRSLIKLIVSRSKRDT